MSNARRYAVWPEPRSRSRSLKGSRPSVPHGTNFYFIVSLIVLIAFIYEYALCNLAIQATETNKCDLNFNKKNNNQNSGWNYIAVYVSKPPEDQSRVKPTACWIRRVESGHIVQAVSCYGRCRFSTKPPTTKCRYAWRDYSLHCRSAEISRRCNHRGRRR